MGWAVIEDKCWVDKVNLLAVVLLIVHVFVLFVVVSPSLLRTPLERQPGVSSCLRRNDEFKEVASSCSLLFFCISLCRSLCLRVSVVRGFEFHTQTLDPKSRSTC